MENDNNSGSLLIEKVTAGDLEAVQKIIGENKAIDYQDIDGQTALMAAVKSNNLAAVKMLVSKGANPNVRDNTLLTPYLCAGANGFHDILEYLILNGADTASVNRFGGTPLLPSSEKGYMRTVEICLKYNIDVNHKNDLGWTALEEAVILGDGGILYSDIIECLIQAGASKDVSDNLGISVKTYAVNQPNVLDILNGTKEINEYDKIIASAKALGRDGNYSKAKDIIEKNKASLPEEQYAYYMGHYAGLLERYDDALAFFAPLTEKFPEFWFYIANCHRLEKNSKKALEAFNMGICESDRPDFFRYHKTNYYRELGMHEEAIEETNELLQKAPARYDYYFHKANSQRSLNQHIEAAQTIENAIKLDPGNALYYFHKAKSYELSGQLEEAVQYYEKAVDRLKRPAYYKELGKCYQLLGEAGKAESAFRTAEGLI